MTMKLSGLVALVLASFAVSSEDASASSVYDLVLGPYATGTVTTDGNTGILSTSDIVGFNITLTAGGLMTNLSYPLTGGFYGTGPGTTAFTATAQGLFFDFSAPDVAGSAQFLAFDASNYLCFNAAAGNCSGQPSSIATSVSNVQLNFPQTGNIEIATSVSAVPLPSTWGMMLMGLIGLGFIAYRQKSKPALMAA